MADFGKEGCLVDRLVLPDTVARSVLRWSALCAPRLEQAVWIDLCLYATDGRESTYTSHYRSRRRRSQLGGFGHSPFARRTMGVLEKEESVTPDSTRRCAEPIWRNSRPSPERAREGGLIGIAEIGRDGCDCEVSLLKPLERFAAPYIGQQV